MRFRKAIYLAESVIFTIILQVKAYATLFPESIIEKGKTNLINLPKEPGRVVCPPRGLILLRQTVICGTPVSAPVLPCVAFG
jgi:hypothetical protein